MYAICAKPLGRCHTPPIARGAREGYRFCGLALTHAKVASSKTRVLDSDHPLPRYQHDRAFSRFQPHDRRFPVHFYTNCWLVSLFALVTSSCIEDGDDCSQQSRPEHPSQNISLLSVETRHFKKILGALEDPRRHVKHVTIDCYKLVWTMYS